MGSIPSDKECINLLKKTGCSEEVIRHCEAVKNVAVKIAKRTNADINLVKAGALLHDIGRSRTHNISHAVEGAKIAKKLGLSDSIINIIERHVGAGLPADEAKKLGLPAKDYMPVTLEEKIVCHADNLISGSNRQYIEDLVEHALQEGHHEYAVRVVKLHKELSEICGIDVNYI